jgi:hypothetical protein
MDSSGCPSVRINRSRSRAISSAQAADPNRITARSPGSARRSRATASSSTAAVSMASVRVRTADPFRYRAQEEAWAAAFSPFFAFSASFSAISRAQSEGWIRA